MSESRSAESGLLQVAQWYPIRCRKCGRKIGLESIVIGDISLTCPKCGTSNRLQPFRPAQLPRFVDWSAVCELYHRPALATY